MTVRTDSTLVDQTAFVAPDAFRTLESSPNQRSPKIQPGVDTGSFVSPNALRALEHVQPKPVETEEKEQPRTPPKVLIPLQPVKIHEGQPINFTAKIDGFPVPSVSDRQKRKDSLNFFFFSSFGLKMVNHYKNRIESGHIMIYQVKLFSYKLAEHGQMIRVNMIFLLKIPLAEIKHKQLLLFHRVQQLIPMVC